MDPAAPTHVPQAEDAHARPGAADAHATDLLVRTLLDRHLDGFVMALGDDGLAVALPADVPLTTQRRATGRSVLDLVAPAHRRVVIEAWEQTRASGAARVQVRLTGADEDVVVHFVDARSAHHAYLAFLRPIDGGDLPEATSAVDEQAATPPRVAIVHKDELGVIVGVDAAVTGILGWTPAELLGSRSLDLVHPDDQDRAIEGWLDLLERPERPGRLRLRYLTSARTWRWMEITNHNRLHQAGDVVGELVDVTEEVVAQEALRASEQLLRRLAETVPVGLAQVDADGRLTYANDRLAELVGHRGATHLAEQLAGASADGARAVSEAVAAVLGDGEDRDLECTFEAHGRDGAPVLTSISIRALAEAGTGSGAIICVSDITESARLRDELAERARRDPLTGGHNRLGLLAELDDLLADPDRRTAVLFVDLDGFKRVNDDLGHHTGDELLRVVVRRLAAAMRPGDVVGRLGGDEFVVLCPDAAADEVDELAQRAELALRSPMVLDGEVVPLRASIGLAHAVGADTAPTQLIAAADGAMYRAKHDRRAGGAGHPVVLPTEPGT